MTAFHRAKNDTGEQQGAAGFVFQLPKKFKNVPNSSTGIEKDHQKQIILPWHALL